MSLRGRQGSMLVLIGGVCVCGGGGDEKREKGMDGLPVDRLRQTVPKIDG